VSRRHRGTRRGTRRGDLVAVLVAGLLVAGCSAGPDEPSSTSTPSPSTSRSSTAAASPSPTVPPPAPHRAACYRLSTADLTRPTDQSTPVSCHSRHTTRTIFVGGPHAGAASTSAGDAARQHPSTTCPRQLARFLGGSAKARDLARFQVVWFTPTREEAAAGAQWFRCDLVAFSRGDRLLALPTKGTLARVLADPAALDTYGLCGTAAPGARGFARVVCGKPHSWRAIDTIALAGGGAYPGAAKVRRAGEQDCKSRARAKAADTLKFKYGWEWPTAEQWRAGQHFGYCWAPS